MYVYACMYIYANVSVLINWPGSYDVFSVCVERACARVSDRECVCISNLPQP
jgi:hypothetical protein